MDRKYTLCRRNNWIGAGALLIFYVLVISPAVYSQRVENQLWLDHNIRIPVSEKFSYGGDISLRGFISNKDWNQLILRPTARYNVNQVFSLGAGTGGFFTFNREMENVSEYRLQEEVNVKWPVSGFIRPFARLRFDQRFIHIQNGPNSSSLRIRYLAGISSRDLALLGESKPVFLKLIWEGFDKIARNGETSFFIDKSRVTVVFGQKISTGLHYEFHFISQRSRSSTSTDLELRPSERVFRFRLFQRLSR